MHPEMTICSMPTMNLLEQANQDKTDKELCALAYIAWAMCSAGSIPDDFSAGMVRLYEKLGFPATQENLTKYCQGKGQ